MTPPRGRQGRCRPSAGRHWLCRPAACLPAGRQRRQGQCSVYVALSLPVAPASMGSSSEFLPGGRTGVRSGLQGVRGPLSAGASVDNGVMSIAEGSMMINNTAVKCIVYLQMYILRSVYYSRTLSNAPLIETESTRPHSINSTIANPKRIIGYGFYTLAS